MPFAPDRLRAWYREAVQEAEAAHSFWDRMKDVQDQSDGLQLAYKGAAQALVAHHHWNPFEKYQHLKEAMHSLDLAVAKAPFQIEIRFLRFSIQHYIPVFVGLSGDLVADKETFLSNLHRFEEWNLEKNIRTMVDFLLASGRCNKEEKKQLESFFVELKED